jgi:hypothetical protein
MKIEYSPLWSRGDVLCYVNNVPSSHEKCSMFRKIIFQIQKNKIIDSYESYYSTGGNRKKK